MRLRMVLFFMAVALVGGCSDTTAALSGFGNANISPHERSLIKQGPLRLPTSLGTLPPPE
ncbi:MAG: hypothetical protein CMH07_09230 [Marinovum sp.]|nr:hypothetical protein [Marinovum sp.]MBQ67080.1 hypothetical protein [Marinovum sp.]